MASAQRSVLIVGCGNIGSRHMQSLVNLPGLLAIHGVEPSGAARRQAEARLAEANPAGDLPELHWYSDLTEEIPVCDLVIEATTAAGRADRIIGLVEMGQRLFLVEKIVCQSAGEYDQITSVMSEHQAQGWVNTARRYFESYSPVHDFFDNHTPLRFSVVSGNDGLGCNAIHYLDLLLWLTGETDISIDGANLSPELLENRRGSNLVEFGGTLSAQTPNGSFATISFMPFSSPATVSIAGENGHLLINETDETITRLDPPGEHAPTAYFNELISQTTGRIVLDILENGKSRLPTLSEAGAVHKELFRVFSDHIEKVTAKRPLLCPIT